MTIFQRASLFSIGLAVATVASGVANVEADSTVQPLTSLPQSWVASYQPNPTKANGPVNIPQWLTVYAGLDLGRWASSPFDNNGVIQYNYGGTIGLQYNPVWVGDYACGLFSAYQNTGDTSYKDKFTAQINWIMNNMSDVGHNAVTFNYKFPFSVAAYHMMPEWHAGLANAEVLSALIRAYYLSKDPKIKDMITKVKTSCCYLRHRAAR